MILSNSSIFATDLGVFGDTSSQCVAVRLLAYKFPGQGAVGSSGASGFSKKKKKKRFPTYQISSVYQAASKNR